VSCRKPKEWRRYGPKRLVLEHKLNVYTGAKDEAEMHLAYVLLLLSVIKKVIRIISSNSVVWCRAKL
jgi:hypothetical protein